MAYTAEQPHAASLSVQDTLLELSTPHKVRTREVCEQDLPTSFSFPRGIIAYGRAVTDRGVQVFEETGQHTESMFVVAIDPQTNEFIRVTSASEPKKSKLTNDYEGVQGIAPKPGFRDTYLPIIGRALGALVRRQKFANIAALEVHTHPPEMQVKLSGNGLSPRELELAKLPLIVAPPSSPDAWKLTYKKWNLGSLVFSPGGVEFMMVATDQTPKYSGEELEKRLRRPDAFAHEMIALRRDYAKWLGGAAVSPILESAVRAMYGEKFPATDSPDLLLRHNLRYLLSGDPHAALFNPVVYYEMAHLKRELESQHCVGYYHISVPGEEECVFSRFTNWTGES